MALPVQLKRREKRLPALVNESGMLAMPCAGFPVTVAMPRTAPFEHRCCATEGLCIRSPTANAEPPRAKNNATSAIAVPGVTEKCRARLMECSFRLG